MTLGPGNNNNNDILFDITDGAIRYWHIICRTLHTEFDTDKFAPLWPYKRLSKRANLLIQTYDEPKIMLQTLNLI